MALTPQLRNQLLTAIQRLQTDSTTVENELQTESVQFISINVSVTTKTALQLQQNSSNENFDALDFEFACYNQQSLLGHLLTMILYAIVCIVGLFGNTLVIYVVLRFSKMQTVTNIYILNLAIADECFLIGIPFLLHTMQMGSWQFGRYMCKAYMVSTSITQFTSSIFLLIMAADRYIAVCHPISSPRFRTPMVSRIVSLLAWMISAFLMLPVMLFANSVEINDHVSCNIKWPESHNTATDSTFIWYTLVLGFATPLAFIMAFYCLVIRKLHTVELKHKSKEKKRSHRKVTKLVLTVISVYIFCWLPYWISQLVLINTNAARCASPLEILIFLLVSCLGYSNSAMNPLLYAFLSDNFKKSFLRAFSCTGGGKRKDIHGIGGGDQQVERSMLPKWGSRKRTQSQADGDGERSGCAGAGFAGYAGYGSAANSSKTGASRSCRGSNASRFLGTSTAGGTGMTATSIMDDANSDLTPMEPLDLAASSKCCLSAEKNSYGNLINGSKVITTDSVVISADVNTGCTTVRPPVLQTDL